VHLSALAERVEHSEREKPFIPSKGMFGGMSEPIRVWPSTRRRACRMRSPKPGGSFAAMGESAKVLIASIFPPSVFS
jgi:hypothetical protein